MSASTLNGINQSESTTTVRQAAELLKAGKLVIVPTETVYGIAVNLQSAEARERVRQLKGMAEPPKWVIHVASAEEALERYVPELSPVGKRLIHKFWPGPVALQVQPTERERAILGELLGPAVNDIWTENMPEANPWYTLRCPDSGITQNILAAAGVPVAIIGANPAGVEQATEMGAIAISVREMVDAIVDGGTTRYRKPSTLVRVEGNALKMVRAGVIDERILQRMTDKVVLFVCSGNTCRSPMAAGIAAKVIADKLGTTAQDVLGKTARTAPGKAATGGILVMSAGVHAGRGMRATMEAVEAAEEFGGDLTMHISQPATVDVLRRADIIYTMTEAHREEVLALLPGAGKKTYRLDAEADIEDPIGADLDIYRQVAGHLHELIQARVKEMLP